MSPQEIAVVLHHFNQQIFKNEKPYVVGNSLGGYLSLWYTKLYQDDVEKLFIMHSPGFPEFKYKALSLITKIGLTKSIYLWLIRNPERFVSKRVHYFDENMLSKEEVNEYAGIFHDKEKKHNFYLILKNSLSVKYMKQNIKDFEQLKLNIPVLLQWAKHDVLVSPEFGKRYQKMLKLKDNDLITHDNTSHFLQVDIPEKVIQDIIDFDVNS